MDGAGNADSDHSMSWEDFFGSTTDLTPTLIGIYDSFLEPPSQSTDGSLLRKPKESKTSKKYESECAMASSTSSSSSSSKDPRLIAGSVRLPGLSEEGTSKADTRVLQPSNKDTADSKMSYVSRFKSFTMRKGNNESQDENTEDRQESDKLSIGGKVPVVKANDVKSCDGRVKVVPQVNSEIIVKVEKTRKHWLEKAASSSSSFENLSPNVKRMLSSAGAESSGPKAAAVPPKKGPGSAGLTRSSYRSTKQSNIPLMGATSKITQSGVEIVSTADIYDRPSDTTSSLTRINLNGSSGRFVPPATYSVSSFSPEKKTKVAEVIENPSAYDVPLNTSAIYDIPINKKPVTVDTKQAAKSRITNAHIENTIKSLVHSNDIEMIDSPDNIDTRRPEAKPTSLHMSPTKDPVRDVADTKPDSKYKQNQEFGNLIVNESPNDFPETTSSTGNLKMSTPTQQESRLNLPGCVQVPRPLSMSSIASSSSTSSSGVQNKGGVNSAYLASIESLDDHSDVDNKLAYAKSARLVQAASTTVNDGDRAPSPGPESGGRAPTPPAPRYCDPSMSLLQRVCTEIVDTENIYVEDLRQVVEGYLYAWHERGTFAPDQLRELFSNIEDIYHFNKTFSLQLNECNLEPVSIARCFVRHSGGFVIYTQYCTAYPGTMAALARLVRAPSSAQPFRQRQAALGHALPLGSYLLKPVQRILKYHLLLQNLVKQCTSHDTEYALDKMTGIARHINDMKRRHEHAVRVQEIQSLLYGWSGQDLTTYGELCAEGTFRVYGAKAMRHAFLFDKMLLLTKNKEYGILAYKSHIMCNNLMLVESIQGQPLSFHVIPFDCPRAQVTLQARSNQHKREWTLLLKRVILENYNAVIPSHARQLVMGLGQNKTDDDMLAEKSSTLISHSSMRKQLSAPEYLEKRKHERERRKSFESGLRYRLKRSNVQKGQNINDSADRQLTDNKKIDRKYDGNICDCKPRCRDCYNLNDSTPDLCKDCQSISDSNVNKSWCSLYLCDKCHKEKESYTFSDSNCDYDGCNKQNLCNCIMSEFQSQSSVDIDFINKKKHCLECDKSIHYIDDEGSRDNCNTENCSQPCSKCFDRDSCREILYQSQSESRPVCSNEELSLGKDIQFDQCHNITRKGSKNDITKKQYDMIDVEDIRGKNRESLNVRKTCLKCQEIKENITVENSIDCSIKNKRLSLKCDHEYNNNSEKRLSKDDSQALIVPKGPGTLRRKSEPGMCNIKFDSNDWKNTVEKDCQKHTPPVEKDFIKKKVDMKCQECSRINNSCSNCGRVTRNIKKTYKCVHNDLIEFTENCKNHPDFKCRSLNREDERKDLKPEGLNPNTLEVKMYNSKTVPKKISKIKKIRAKTMKHSAMDSTAKFYTDFKNDFSTDNVLHISESTDSINTINSLRNEIHNENSKSNEEQLIKTDSLDIDDELYKSLIQKTDSFKKSEIEKDKLVSTQTTKNPIKIEIDEFSIKNDKLLPNTSNVELDDDIFESCDEVQNEKPLEQIISQMIMQNREFQKILKRHQFRNATNRRHQRLLKSYSNPEKTLPQNRENQLKLRPKFGRQTSATESTSHDYETVNIKMTNESDENPKNYVRPPVEEHIYETLKTPEKFTCVKQDFVTKQETRDLDSVDIDKKNSCATQNKSLLELPVGKQTRISLTESDYVYLCFDGKKTVNAYRIPENTNNIDNFEDDGEYAVPSVSLLKINPEVERRVTKDTIKIDCNPSNYRNPDEGDKIEHHYDNASEIWKRISNDTVIENPNMANKKAKDNTNKFNIDEYLEADNGSKSPNLPEIWLDRQKEHFKTSRDKKSGSLPRSFQVILNDPNHKPVNSTQNKHKIYLTKHGKVLQTDRPFTIASDHSEICYEDIERFMNVDDSSNLKFPSDMMSSNRSFQSYINMDDTVDSVSRSTLELEAEIERCYKNNFECENLNSASNTNLLINPTHSVSMANSISSSMEVMNDKTESRISQEDISTPVHPEHKIYKTTTNVLSLKNVLNKFKMIGRNSSEQNNGNVSGVENEKDTQKLSQKKVTSTKNYPKNLMQRFKRIMNDEQDDTIDSLEYNSNEILSDCVNSSLLQDTSEASNIKSSITVLLSQTDDSITKNNDFGIFKSFCETTMPSSIGSPEFVSKSCNNISSPDKSQLNLGNNSTNMSASAQFTPPSSIKLPQSSIQDLNKLPIYKQGSRHLGARIAQSDYADPKALFTTESSSDLDKVNILINKNAIRPDSLLSNSSHFTSSSEGCLNPTTELNRNNSFLYKDRNKFDYFKEKTNNGVKESCSKTEVKHIEDNIDMTKFNFKTDESFYEKSFDEIEYMLGAEIFRDSAIYSDPEDGILYSPTVSSSKAVSKASHKQSSTNKNDGSVKRTNFTSNLERVISTGKKDELEQKKLTIPLISYTSYVEDKTDDIKPNVKRSLSMQDEMTEKNGSTNPAKSFTHDINNAPKYTFVNKNSIKPAPPVPAKPMVYKSNLVLRSSPQKSSSSIVLGNPIKKSPTSKNPVLKDVEKSDSSQASLKYSPKSFNFSVNNQDKNVNTATAKISTSNAAIVPEICEKNNEREVSGKLSLTIKLTEKSSNLVPPLKSPKVEIPRPNYERSTSSNIQIKRMSFERCSFDPSALGRRSKSVSNEIDNPKNENVIVTKSVQERKKEIEMMSMNVSEIKNKLNNDTNQASNGKLEGEEYSSSALTRTLTSNIKSNSSKDQSKNIQSLKNSNQVLKSNIPLPNIFNTMRFDHSSIRDSSFSKSDKNGASNEGSVKDIKKSTVGDSSTESVQDIDATSNNESSREGGWVKHVVNKFQ